MAVEIVLAMLAIRKPMEGTIMKPSGLRGDSNGNGNGNCSNHNHTSNPLPFWLNHRKKLASA